MALLSCLGSGELFQVLRHLSETPWLEGKPLCFRIDVLLQLFDACGPFSERLVSELKEIAVDANDITPESLLFSCPSTTFEQFGRSVRRLVITEDALLTMFGEADGDDHHTNVCNELSQHLHGLQHLSIKQLTSRSKWTVLADKSSSSIEKLFISYMHAHRGRVPCTLPDTPLLELKELLLKGCCIESADELGFFLSTSGGKLEFIYLRCMWLSVAGFKAVINSLRTSCRKVRKIYLSADDDIHMVPEVELEIRRLLISYGNQLLNADLQQFPIMTCEEVLIQCPNVQCKYSFRNVECLNELEKFVLLAPRIDNLSLCVKDTALLIPASQRDRFEAALSSCIKLKCFNAPQFNKDGQYNKLITKRIFANPHSTLEALYLNLPVVDRGIVLLMTPSVHTLRCLCVRVDKAQCDGLVRLFEVCSNLVDARFIIADVLTEIESLNCTAQLIQVAWSSGTLRNLVITFEKAEKEWEQKEKEQFLDALEPVVQKMRLRRCKVAVCGKKFFS